MVETPARIEPCLFLDPIPGVLADLAVELQRAASDLGRGLHPESATELADFVRMLNCDYSNLIEGHNAKPRDIERALAGAEIEPGQRALAWEAKAHVSVQRLIDERYRRGELPDPTSIGFIQEIHRLFYDNMPLEFRYADRPDGTRAEIVSGRFRQTDDEAVTVGRHRPPSSANVETFVQHFSRRFSAVAGKASAAIIAIASAHHRFNFIHPFVDGNGRVSRLMSHAMALKAGVGSHGLWSISRGLARGLADRGEYKRMLDNADSPRRGDLDGRGNLSEAALKDFCEWFLLVALDQVRFSTALFNLTTLEDRYRALIKDVSDDKRAPDLVSAVLKYGSLDRGDAAFVLKSAERTARSTLSTLVSQGFLKSDSPKGPVRLAFPLTYRERLFPNLFADGELTVPQPRPLTFG